MKDQKLERLEANLELIKLLTMVVKADNGERSFTRLLSFYDFIDSDNPYSNYNEESKSRLDEVNHTLKGIWPEN